MIARRFPPKQRSFDSVISKVPKVAGALITCLALINGGFDIVNRIVNSPKGEKDKVDSALRDAHFNEQPLVDRTVTVGNSARKVDLVLMVYPNGDLLVNYGGLQQWLPFKSLQRASLSLFQEAFAQAPPASQSASDSASLRQSQVPIYIDLDKLNIEGARASTVAPNAISIEKNYVLAEKKEDHPYLFERSKQPYSRKFLAEPGYRFTNFEFVLGTSSHYAPGKIDIVENGNAIVATFTLRSGSALNRYSGWVQGSLKTRQQRLDKGVN